MSFAGCRARSNRRDGWLVVCSFAAPGPSRPAPARFVLPPCPLSSSSSSPRRAISSDRGPPPRGQKKPDCQPPPIICYFRTEMEPTLIQAPPGASPCVGGVSGGKIGGPILRALPKNSLARYSTLCMYFTYIPPSSFRSATDRSTPVGVNGTTTTPTNKNNNHDGRRIIPLRPTKAEEDGGGRPVRNGRRRWRH